MPYLKQLFTFLFILIITFYSISAYSQQLIDEDLSLLIELFYDADVNSTEEKELGDRILNVVEAKLGKETIDEYQYYLSTPLGSDQEKQSYERFIVLSENRGVDSIIAEEMLSEYIFIKEYNSTIFQQRNSDGFTQQFDNLFRQWNNSVVNSPEEEDLGNRILNFVEVNLGQEIINEYRFYLDTETDSFEEQQSYQRLISLIQNVGTDINSVGEILNSYIFIESYNPQYQQAVTSASVSEPSTSNKPSQNLEDIEVRIYEELSFYGEEAFIYAEIINNSANTIYMNQSRTLLELNADLASLFNIDRAEPYIPANFPPHYRRVQVNNGNITEEWIAVPKGSRFRVQWHGKQDEYGFLMRLNQIFFGPAPGQYDLGSSISYSSTLPRASTNLKNASALGTINIKPLISNMLPFVWIGGLMILMLQWLEFSNKTKKESPKKIKKTAMEALKGLLSMVALTSVIVMLSTGFEDIEIMPQLDIGSHIAAIASGMIIQLLGYPYFKPLIKGNLTNQSPMANPKPQVQN